MSILLQKFFNKPRHFSSVQFCNLFFYFISSWYCLYFCITVRGNASSHALPAFGQVEQIIPTYAQCKLVGGGDICVCAVARFRFPNISLLLAQLGSIQMLLYIIIYCCLTCQHLQHCHKSRSRSTVKKHSL